jgi:hypothetical protein
VGCPTTVRTGTMSEPPGTYNGIGSLTMDDVDPTVDLAALEDDDDGQPGDGVEDDASRSPKPEGPLDKAVGLHVFKLRKKITSNRDDFVKLIKPKAAGELWNKARLGRIERGYQRVTLTELDDLCDTLGVPLLTFLADALPDKEQPRSKTRGMIEADATIDPEDRVNLARQYDRAQQAYKAQNPGRFN